MTAVTIIVEFETKPGSEAAFERMAVGHALRTLQEEPGCLRFEVIRPVGKSGQPDPDKLIVNELYADPAALIAHRANPRMPSVRAAITEHTLSQRLIEAHAVDGAAQPAQQGIRPENLNAANDD